MIGFFEPALSSALRNAGAAETTAPTAAVLRKSRLEASVESEDISAPVVGPVRRTGPLTCVLSKGLRGIQFTHCREILPTTQGEFRAYPTMGRTRQRSCSANRTYHDPYGQSRIC